MNAKLPPAELFLPSLTDLVSYVEVLPHSGDSGERNYSGWAGGHFANVKKCALEGWKEGATRATEVATRIANRVVAAPSSSLLHAVEYDVMGAAYDAGAYDQAVPECWAVMKPTEAKRGVRICVNLATSAVVNASVIENRGIAVAAFALVLQAQGYAVTIDAGERSYYGGKFETVLVRLADGSSGSPLDLDRIVFGLAHPGMPRQLLAAVADGQQGYVSRSRWGASIPADEITTDWAGPFELYIGKAHLHDAARWIDGGEAWVLSEYQHQTTGS